jgi:putative cardiolipin synthase
MKAHAAVAGGAVLALLLSGCDGLPTLEGRPATVALTDTSATRLGEALAPLLAAHTGRTGIHPLVGGRDAFAARALLADAAEKSIDVQYYIWHGDETGTLMFEAMWRAAERGVRVRMLLDDNSTAGLDGVIAALDAHPNIEVRLYNPLGNRTARSMNYVADFSRVNRRMHNKSFTVDDQATIVGGRNVGNEYFDAGSGFWFQDLDVIALGAVVHEVSDAFDLYWNSASAYPAASLVKPPTQKDEAALQERFANVRADPVAASYVQALRDTPLVRDLLARSLDIEWTSVHLVHDDPAKTLDESGRTDVLLLASMTEVLTRPEKSFDLVSPYFVPGEQGTATFIALAKRGVAVRVLVNSLATTDVSAVHAGYLKRRKALLEAGIRLFELKPMVIDTGAPREKHESAEAALHAKTFAVDGTRLFVGSFNFDPRSAQLNTELGLLIDSPVLAAQLVHTFDANVPKVAYEVRLDPNGNLEWVERTDAGEKFYDTEPEVGVFRRGLVRFLSWFPIDWML